MAGTYPDQLLGRPAVAHQIQHFASPPPMTAAPFYQILQPIYPDQLRGRPSTAHQIPYLFKASAQVQPTVAQPIQPVTPNRLVGRPARAHEFQFLAKPGKLVTPVTPAIPGYGVAGAATFVLALETGAKITFAWATDIFRSYSGVEQRSSPFERPRRTIEGTAVLLDASSRDTRARLQKAAAAASTFLLALPFDELIISADSINTTITVVSTTSCDWALPGQRIIVIGNDGSTVGAIVQSTTSTTISIVTVDSNGNFNFGVLGSTGKAGALVMPLLQVQLDPQQGFTRYPIAMDMWSIKAMSQVFGWAGVDAMGRGAQIFTYTAGGPVSATSVTDADLIIWDRPNMIDGTANDAMMTGGEALDLGALISGFSNQTVPDWARPVKYVSSSRAEWQWLQSFLRLCRGRQRAWLLSTNRDDLIFVSAISGGITVQSSSVAGGGDYASWWVSLAHRRLAFTMADGSVNYSTVLTAPIDNGDGTLSVLLDANPAGTISRISLAEQLRIDNDNSDDIPVTWDGPTFTIELVARAVQETIVPPPLFMFDAIFSQTYSYGPPPPLPPTDQEFAFALGQSTLLYWTSDRSLTFGGITVPGGATDGMVLCVAVVNLNAFSLTVAHEDTTWAAGDRIWLPNRSNLGGVEKTFWFIYNATVQRWICWKFS